MPMAASEIEALANQPLLTVLVLTAIGSAVRQPWPSA